jgi:hypothetical protein
MKLLEFLGIFLVFIVIMAFSIDRPKTSQEILTEICTLENATLKYEGGQWNCEIISYAEGYYHDYDTPIEINISSADVYYNITGFALDNVRAFDTLGNSVRARHEGIYSVLGTMSFRGGNGGEYEVELFINDVGQEECVFFRTTSTNAIGDASLSCIIALEVNDVLIMKIKDLSAPAQDVEIDQLNFKIVEIH